MAKSICVALWVTVKAVTWIGTWGKVLNCWTRSTHLGDKLGK